MTTPSVPPIALAGEPVAKPNYVALARESGLQLRIDSKFGNPDYISVMGSWPALVKFAELVAAPSPSASSVPVAIPCDFCPNPNTCEESGKCARIVYATRDAAPSDAQVIGYVNTRWAEHRRGSATIYPESHPRLATFPLIAASAQKDKS